RTAGLKLRERRHPAGCRVGLTSLANKASRELQPNCPGATLCLFGKQRSGDLTLDFFRNLAPAIRYFAPPLGRIDDWLCRHLGRALAAHARTAVFWPHRLAQPADSRAAAKADAQRTRAPLARICVFSMDSPGCCCISRRRHSAGASRGYVPRTLQA